MPRVGPAQMGGTWVRSGMPNATTSTVAYNADNELTSWNGTALSYDANGNMLSDGTNTYTWNKRNQLGGISGLYNASFVYGPFGRRQQKTIGGNTTDYLYDGFNPIQELSGGTVDANMLDGLSVDEYFQRADLLGTWDYLSNALGSTIALADTTGTVQTQYTYDPFGGTTVQGGANANSYQFTGRENDGQGLYYYRARYYDPMLSRFISQDPLAFASGEVNLYAYASDSPLNFGDPSGLSTVQFGVSGSVRIFGVFGGTGSLGLALDSQGRVAWYYTYGGGAVGAGARFSGGAGAAYSNAQTVCDLGGPFANLSAGAGEGASAAGDIFAGNSHDGPVIGVGATVGAGFGASGSVTITRTSVHPFGKGCPCQ